jgi:WXG100 family type VII secretion target
MLAAAGRMSEAQHRIDGLRDNVEAQMNSLAATFTGSAATAFKGAMSGWYNNVAEINTALGEMVRIMQDGAQLVGKSDSDTENEAQEAHNRMVSLPGLNGL